MIHVTSYDLGLLSLYTTIDMKLILHVVYVSGDGTRWVHTKVQKEPQ